MAKTPAVIEDSTETIPETESTVEQTPVPQGIHILDDAGKCLGEGYASVEAAQAHINAHLIDVACRIVEG